MERPTHLSKDIEATVREQLSYATTAFLSGDDARAQEWARRERLVAEVEAAAAAANEAANEAAKVRKDPSCPSFHGGFGERTLQMVPVGCGLGYAASAIHEALGEAPPYKAPKKPTTPAIDPTLPVATGAEGFDVPIDGAVSASGETSARLLASPFDTARSGGKNSVPPLRASTKLAAPFASPEPPFLPPPAQRLSTRVPPRVDGGARAAKATAPIVSELPAQASPNLLNLLLEVPYKRGVHTVSVNQRYLNHEPTFDPAFELLPAAAHFGTLRAHAIYRFRLVLTNTSNLPQRFVVKHGPQQQSRMIFTPGVAAPGLSVPMEVEVSAPPGKLAESLSIVTEREEIVLPVTASVISADKYDGLGHPLCAVGARMIAEEPREPDLGKTVPVTVSDPGPGTKRFAVPLRDPNAPHRPDFDDLSEDDEATVS